MAFKKFDGYVAIIPATADTAVRDVIAFGTNSVGVALTSGLTGEDISVDTVGVYEFLADTSEAFAIGDIAKWDTTDKKMISTGTVTAGVIWKGKSASVAGTIYVKIG